MAKTDFEKRWEKINGLPAEELDEETLNMLENDPDCKEVWGSFEEYKKQREKSGKINLRLPLILHEQIAEIAQEEHTSVNQFIIYAISKAIGERAYLLRK